MKRFEKIFSRVNHVYFTDHTQLPEDSESQIMQTVSIDYKCLDIIDNIKFDIGVQAFLNLNRVVTFHVDMKNPKWHQIQPDQLVLDEIKYFMDSQQQNNIRGEAVRMHVQSVNPSANTNVSPSSCDVNDAVSPLLDLGINSLSSEYEHNFHTQIRDNVD